MKTLLKISALLMLIAMVTPAFSQSPVQVVNTRNQHQLVFKVQKEMLGAYVGIQSKDGNRINAQRLRRRKMIIDFIDLPVGYYTVVVEKDGKTESFEYVRNWQ